MNALYEAAEFFERAEKARLLRAASEPVTEMRLRVGARPLLRFPEGEEAFGRATEEREMLGILSGLLSHSLYAWEDELGMGYFTLESGARVGVCGVFSEENGRTRLVRIQSMLFRVAREVRGCAQALADVVCQRGAVKNALILSAPGMGKTTLLRDAARLLSERGFQVGVADERYEIAARRTGAGGMDVGERTDVASGLSKDALLIRLIRSMAPQVVITDEIGSAEDARAIQEASRMGVSVIASAHADSLQSAMHRGCLREMLLSGTFDAAVVLKGEIGRIDTVHLLEKTEGKWEFG